MTYSKLLKELFAGISLDAGDLLFLEIFQIKYLPDRIPKKEFSVLLRGNPLIHQFMVTKYPPIKNFIDTVFNEYKPVHDEKTIEELSQELLWEIADLIVYNKYPELYDEKVKLNWNSNDISSITSLEGKTVIDVGAGSGRFAFEIAKLAKTVFAVEPVTGLRRFIREKAAREKVINLFALDGFLDSIPFPDDSMDILVTSNAIGWNLENELIEIERVLKPGGHAIHLLRSLDEMEENPFHSVLTSDTWNYAIIQIPEEKGMRLKYFKTIK